MSVAAPPGLLIAAPRSGSGKTTLTLGLMRAARQRGRRVLGAKCGPDYIDPAFHAAATGRPGLNLDSWAMEPALRHALVAGVAEAADLILCEGLMGLFDGVPAEPGRSGSSADIAAAFGWPVILILDVSGQSQSAAATALGCATLDPRLTIAGVVLNRIGSVRHQMLAAQAIERVGLPVLGALRRAPEITLPERHLGLVQAGETADLDLTLDRLAGFIETQIDVDQLLDLAVPSRVEGREPVPARKPPGQRIAVARDAAFSFLYPHLLQGWRAAGAELSFFSPLADEAPPPDCDFCWLPGGYPELYAGKIAAAPRFLEGTRRFAESRPVHGECGGYMVLGRGLIDASGAHHEMLGLLGLSTSFEKRRLTLGYREAELLADTALGPRGAKLRGHEFHYATIADKGDDAPFAILNDAYGSTPSLAGSVRAQVSGSFFHIIA
ncbi:cobyrinate a,c-diamide synthase [Methylovirgula sp. HY1]|uniref:cobyrinate a,c-diamide synthase n=1 Tax=Methylovirgula sp. HY1 TaxID=2822761 RepID=UPI001C5B285D|nr:cobyrinate a,c-diamide synthase [Methylovirgula sp. HY1]